MSNPHPRSALTLIELLVVIAIIGVLIGLLLSAVAHARLTAQKAACMNNLKLMGLALHQYHQIHQLFPPGCSYEEGADPHPYMSWITRLLPFLEEQSLWQESMHAYALANFFEDPPHQPLLGRYMSGFVCPADPYSSQPCMFGTMQVAFTDYLGVEGMDFASGDGVLYLDSRVRMADITDGLSNTVIVGERPPSSDHKLGWWYAGMGQEKTGSADLTLGVREVIISPDYSFCPRGPYRFQRERGETPCSAFHFWSLHPGGAHFLFSDGSAYFINYSSDRILPALATRAGGEVVSQDY